MVSLAKTRAKARGLEFDLTEQDILPLPERCPVLGIYIEYGGDRQNNHNAASLDRIDNTKGYMRGNVIVVSLRANHLKRDATSDELRQLADYYCK